MKISRIMSTSKIFVLYRFMFNKTNNKNKQQSKIYCSQCFSSERVLIEHKKVV